MSEITRNFNRLVRDLQSQESPEAMAYLRIMGAELGYIKASDLKFIAENAKMYTDIFMRIIPTKVRFFFFFQFSFYPLERLRSDQCANVPQ